MCTCLTSVIAGKGWTNSLNAASVTFKHQVVGCIGEQHLLSDRKQTVSRVVLALIGSMYITMTQCTVTHSDAGRQQTLLEPMPRGEKTVLLLSCFQVQSCICLVYH